MSVASIVVDRALHVDRHAARQLAAGRLPRRRSRPETAAARPARRREQAQQRERRSSRRRCRTASRPTASGSATRLTWQRCGSVLADALGHAADRERLRRVAGDRGCRGTNRPIAGDSGSAAQPAAPRSSCRASVDTHPFKTPKGTRPWTHPSIDRTKLDAFVMRAVGDLSAGYGGVMVSLGSQARPLQGHGRRRPAELARARGARRLRRALRARVAERAGRRRLRRATTRSATPTS